MAQRRIIKKAEQLMGEPVVDAVAVVRQPKWALTLFALLLIPLLMQVNLIVMALLGGVVGLLIAAVSEYKILARGTSRIGLLSASGVPFIRATKLDRQLEPAEVMFVDTTGVKRAITIAGRRYHFARINDRRLRAILGQTG